MILEQYIKELKKINQLKKACIINQTYDKASTLRDKQKELIFKIKEIDPNFSDDEFADEDDFETEDAFDLEKILDDIDDEIDAIDMDSLTEDYEEDIDDFDIDSNETTDDLDLDEQPDHIISPDEVVPEIKNKYKLKYDSIFKGKKRIEDEEYAQSLYIDTFSGLGQEPEIYEEEEDAKRRLRLKDLVYDCLVNMTTVRLDGMRRKPSRIDFNIYYKVLLNNIDNVLYTKTEIFCELSQYFSDQYYSMLKMLDKNYSDEIINELQEKYCKVDLRKVDFL